MSVGMLRFLVSCLVVSMLAGCGRKAVEPPLKTVKTQLQTRPGGPFEVADIAVQPAPDDLPDVPADQAELQDDDLVMGVVIADRAMAYPIRYMGMEIANHRIGDTPVAPSW